MSKPMPESIRGLRIIDADTHLAERYDLRTSRAPAAYKSRVPQVKDVNGALTWVIDGDIVMGPDPVDYIAGATGQFTPEERRKFLGANAAKLYKIPLA
jgi:hypothetical protein